MLIRDLILFEFDGWLGTIRTSVNCDVAGRLWRHEMLSHALYGISRSQTPVTCRTRPDETVSHFWIIRYSCWICRCTHNVILCSRLHVSYHNDLNVLFMDIDIIDPDRHSNTFKGYFALQWRHNECDGVSNHQPHDCLLNRYSRSRSRKTSKLRVNGPCERIHRSPVNSPHKGPVTRKNVSIWWRHHGQRYSPWWMFLFNTLSMCAQVLFSIYLSYTRRIFWWIDINLHICEIDTLQQPFVIMCILF